MKNIIFLCLLFINLASFGQTKCDSNSKYVDKLIYQVCYSEHYKNPLWVKYKLYKPISQVERKGNFYLQKGIITATNKDFEGNQFDKGHMCPAENFSDCDSNMHKTFSYLNCSVQNFELNRGTWKMLEFKERQWSQTDSLLIICEAVLTSKSKMLPTGAYVPDKFRKTIIFLTTNKRLVFEFPNEKCDKNIYLYQIKN